jgi:hypothetical protein
MAYFGNSPISASYLTDYFSGNNTTVAFTLSRAPVSASSVIITISGVKQAASTYGVSGTTLTFSGAPPTGTNNIEVLHLGVQPDTVVQPSYRTITEFTATAGQTSFSPASYTAGYIDVYRNGVKLGSADFTATNGTTVVLANACAAGDYVRFEGFLITTFNNAIPNTAGAVGSSLIADATVTDAKIYQVSASKLTGSQTVPFSVLPTGSILQVVQTNLSSTYSFTTTTLALITGFTASITPKFSTSKILMIVSLGKVTNSSAALGTTSFAFAKNGTLIAIGDSSLTRMQATFSIATNGDANHGVGASFSYLDSPATTSAITYSLYGAAQNSTSYINRTVDDYNNTLSYPARTDSTIILMEIAG